MMRATTCLTLLFAAGCALTSKGDALSIRYFTPEAAAKPASSAERAAGPEVRLGRVTSGAHLRERIAYRGGANEIGYYDERRWTERPALFVGRQLARSLYDTHALSRAVSGSAPTLDVEVISFEELKVAGTHAARIELRIVLSDERETLVDKTLAVERPIGQGDFEAVAAAMTGALQTIADEAARDVDRALRARAPSEQAAIPQ